VSVQVTRRAPGSRARGLLHNLLALAVYHIASLPAIPGAPPSDLAPFTGARMGGMRRLAPAPAISFLSATENTKVLAGGRT